MKKKLATVMAATMAVSGSVVSVNAATTDEQLIGSNRTDTAVKISKEGWYSADTVILVNDAAIPDALTATPLAHAKNAPILLTGKGGLTKATADEIKRLGAKDVIMIGGDAVLPAKIENDLKALKVKADRVKGATREETALAIAKRLDGIKDVSEIAVVNSTTGLADAVSVAAAAAEKGMPIILANPTKGLSAAEKFIKDEAIKSSFVIGGKTALPEKLVESLPAKQRIEGANRNDTNARVIEKFYGDKELDNLYLAKDGRGGDTQLIDALAVGALAAKNGAPVLIASKSLNANQINVINTKKIDTITQVGGKGNEGAFSQLKEIEKAEVIKVKNEAELQEALKKANANDTIEIDKDAFIAKDLTLSTNNAIKIDVKGDLTGKVTVKTPNADIKNSGTIGTLVVSNGKNTTVTNTSAGKINKVEVSSSSSNVKVENNGKIEKVENNASGTSIENNGTISKPIEGTNKPSVEGNKPGGGTTGPVTPSIDQGKVDVVDRAKKAVSYKYDNYNYRGKITVTGNESANVEIVGPYDETNLNEAMYDMARYLGALYRTTEGTKIKAIEYKGEEYKWSNKITLEGSNWVKDVNNEETKGNTLISNIVTDFTANKNPNIEMVLVGENNKRVSMNMKFVQKIVAEAGKKKYSTIEDAIATNQPVTLLKDITVSETIKFNSVKEIVIDLGGNTLKSTATNGETGAKVFEPIKSDKKLTIKNGNLEATSTGVSVSCIKVEAGGEINLNAVNYKTEGTGIFVLGEKATVNVLNNSTINAKGFCVSTNAAVEANHGVIINLTNSNFESTDAAPILVNVPCTFNMTGGTVIGHYQGVIVRGGTAKIDGTTITNTVDTKENKYLDTTWGDGNNLPQAALVIGNRSTAYQYASDVTLTNCTINQNGKAEEVPAIYMYGNEKEGLGATLTYDDKSNIAENDIVKGNGKCTINKTGETTSK